MIGNTLTIRTYHDGHELSSPLLRKGLTVIGAIFTVLGLFAILAPAAAGLATDLVIGWLLLLGGGIALATVFTSKRTQGAWRGIVLGGVATLLGLYLILEPTGGTVLISGLVALFFLLDGFFGLAAAFSTRGTPASLLLGVMAGLSVLLAVILLAMIPEAAASILGVLVGVALLIDGIGSLLIARKLA